MAVFFQQQRAVDRRARLLLQTRFHRRDRDQLRFDKPVAGRRFRKRFRQVRCKTLQTRVGVVHVGAGQSNVRQSFGKRGGTWVTPGGLFQGDQIRQQRKPVDEAGKVSRFHNLSQNLVRSDSTPIVKKHAKYRVKHLMICKGRRVKAVDCHHVSDRFRLGLCC